MVIVLCGDCYDHFVYNERDVTKTLQYVSICMMTVLGHIGFTLFRGDDQPLSSYPIGSKVSNAFGNYLMYV